MHVVATAGHVDHGKSTLVRALTGTDPDRLAEERRRGLTIELGYAWTDLPSGERLAFVDVPGHERFLATMLSGVGPVPAALLVVAADEGWSAQTAEHVAALDALGVEHVLLAVTKCDRADPAAAAEQVQERRSMPWVGVSARTGAGLDDLRAALDDLVAGLPEPGKPWRTRMFVDRAFSVAGAGTVVTGTLAAGRLAVGDELEIAGRGVRVRRLESCHEPLERIGAVARVAVNLRGVKAADVGRGAALVTPGAWPAVTTVDARLTAPARGELVLHVGSAGVPVHVRPLGDAFARLTLARPLPLEPGDRGVLRDPSHHAVAAGLVVLDPYPPPLVGRGAARRRAVELASEGPRRWCRGVDDPALEPTAPATPPPSLDLPEIAWGTGAFALAELDPKERSLAREAGLITQVGDLAMRPTVADDAVDVLVRLPQPFTTQDAKAALGVTRRTLIPLLEHLDRQRRTTRDGDLRRVR